MARKISVTDTIPLRAPVRAGVERRRLRQSARTAAAAAPASRRLRVAERTRRSGGGASGALRDALARAGGRRAFSESIRVSGIEFVKPGSNSPARPISSARSSNAPPSASFRKAAPPETFAALLSEHRALALALASERSAPPIVDELERLESRLHGSIVQALANPLIDSSYARITYTCVLCGWERSLTAPLALRSLNEHLRIIEACAARGSGSRGSRSACAFYAALQRHMGLA